MWHYVYPNPNPYLLAWPSFSIKPPNCCALLVLSELCDNCPNSSSGLNKCIRLPEQ